MIDHSGHTLEYGHGWTLCHTCGVNIGFQWVPPKFDPARERAGEDRDSQAPVILAGLMNDMDVLCTKFRRHSASPDTELLAAIGNDIVIKWAAIRKAQGL